MNMKSCVICRDRYREDAITEIDGKNYCPSCKELKEPTREPVRMRADELQTIAQAQRHVAIFLLGGLLLVGCQLSSGQGATLLPQPYLGILSAIWGVCQVPFLVRLVRLLALRPVAYVVLSVLGIAAPIAAVIVLAASVLKATQRLQENDIEVGLLGARFISVQ